MSEGKIETVKGFCVVALTRHFMETLNLKQDEAFEKLMKTELYSLLMDEETRLYLETNEELCRLSDLELTEGTDALYEAIRIAGNN